MRSRRISYVLIPVSLLAVFLLASGFVILKGGKYHKVVQLSNEKEVKVTLESGYGTIYVSRGSANAVLDADVDAENNIDISNCIEYSKRERVGFLNINTSEDVEGKSDHKHGFHISGLESNTWDMHFTDAVPLSFDVELGLGKGVLDLTGLTVKDVTISAGASSFLLKFDRPNKGSIDDLSIESGVSKFNAEGLCNANFNHFKFQGGVGTYALDFGGALNREADVDIEVGLGSLTVTIPENIGARIIYEKNFIAHLDIDKDFTEQSENTYVSSNFDDAPGKLNMRIEAGLGSVKVRREP
jgi:hypothetical protein